MTSRTIDVCCHVCKKYMYSEIPSGSWNETWVKKHYCKKKSCQERATFDKLQGPEEIKPLTQEDIRKLFADIAKEKAAKKNEK